MKNPTSPRRGGRSPAWPARLSLAAALAAAPVALPLSSCATTEETEPLGKLAADKLELERLKRDIIKVDKSIDVTKELVRRSKGERYLPDLYFRLAELYIEKSRLVYFRILEEAGADDKTAVVAPEARLLKDQAIAVYKRILQEFPDYLDNDKITFFIAHEYRELGNFQEMIKTYEELVAKYSKSNFRYEAWLILGDYNFDKGDIDEAINNYRAILKGPENYASNMARYKLAWCYINKDKTNLAVDLWEQAVKTPTPAEPGLDAPTNTLLEKPGRLDVRQEALRDLAYYFPDVREAKNALPYFAEITVTRQEYKMALERLARRFSIKTMYEDAAGVYRELIKASHDVERNLEWAEAVYEAAVAAKDLTHAAEDVIMLSEVSARFKFWWRSPDADKKVLKDFELLTRDLSTRIHALAKERGDPEQYARAAKAYEAYLSVFDDGPERLSMEWNYAETLYSAKRFVRAGQQYEKVLALLTGPTPTDAPAAGEKPADKTADGKPAAKPADKPADPKAPAADPKKPADKTVPGNTVAAARNLSAATGNVEGDKKQAMYSAILSYFEALKVEEKGTRFDSMMAREGIKDLGGRFVTKYPDDGNTQQVKFNVARAYFEQGLFDKSIELFTAFVAEYPQNKDAIAAADLALDAFAQKEDFGGLAKGARAFAADTRLDATNRERFAKMADQADQEELNRTTIDAKGDVSAAIVTFAGQKGKGSEAGARALYQGFVIAKDRRNLNDMQTLGRQLLEDYGQTKEALDVLPALADYMVRVSQMEQAASYYEEYARRYPQGQGADEVLEGAAQIRFELGEFASAMADYERLTRQGDDAQRAGWVAQIAKAAAKVGDWRRVEEAALDITDTGYAVMANTLAGEAALRTGKADVAVERLSNAINAAPKRGADDDTLEWQGRAQFLLGELIRAEFDRVQFGAGDEGTVLQDKFALLQELEGAYVAAIQVGDPEWAMGGLYRIANAYRQAADFLDRAPAPKGISPEDEKQYRAALAERSAPLRKQAADALETCKKKARELEAFNRFVKACVAGGEVDDDADNPRPRPAGVAIPGREQLEQKLIENPKDVATLVQLIRAAIAVKDHPLAKLLAIRALELDEKNATLHNLHGVALVGSNQMQAAAGAFKRALRQNNKHPEANANLGALYAIYGDERRASEAFGKAGGVDAGAPDIVPIYREARASLK